MWLNVAFSLLFASRSFIFSFKNAVLVFCGMFETSLTNKVSEVEGTKFSEETSSRFSISDDNTECIDGIAKSQQKHKMLVVSSLGK